MCFISGLNNYIYILELVMISAMIPRLIDVVT